MREKTRDGLDRLIEISTAAIALLVVSAVLAYVVTFGTSISTESSKWSDFGSFIGGIFSPLVSFVALIAIIRTISLQRVMLKTQRHEFEKLKEIQDKTYNSQLEQLANSQKALLNEQVNNYKASIMRMVEQQIEFYSSKLVHIKDSVQYISQHGASLPREITMKQISEAEKKQEVILSRLNGLNKFAMAFSLQEHFSIQQIKEDVAKNLAEAFSK